MESFRNRAISIVIILAVFALSAVCQQTQNMPTAPQAAPLTQDQVVGLIRGGVATQRILSLVEARGVDFKLTNALLKNLQKSGASQPLLDQLKQVSAMDFTAEKPSVDRWYSAQAERVRGKQLLDRQAWAQAETALRHSIKLNPTDAASHFYLGMALSRQNQLNGSITEYREAILLDPDSAPARFNLGNQLMKKQDVAGALHQYREAQSLKPSDADIRYALGTALYRQGDAAGAAAEFRAALRLQPSNSESHLALGLALAKEKDLAGAIHEYHLALETEPGDAVVHADLASALLAQGDSHQALEELRIAASLQPGNAAYHASYDHLASQLDTAR